MAADMICAYYDREADIRELFEQRKLAEWAPVIYEGRELTWDAYLGKFDVSHIVMTDFPYRRKHIQEVIDYLIDEVSGELLEAYPEVDSGKRRDLRTYMNKIYGKTKC